MRHNGSMEFNAAVVAGATGMIGRYLIRTLLEDPFYDAIITLTRRPLEMEEGRLNNALSTSTV